MRSLDARRLPDPPPGPVVQALLATRRLLLRLADRVVPPELAAIDHAIGFGVSIALREVARLGVADLLADGPRDAEALAQALGVRPDPLHRVLRALCARGIFTLDAHGRFANNHVSRALRTGAGTARTFAAYVGDRHNLLAWDRLDAVLREGGDGFARAYGESVWAWYEKNEPERAQFAAMMADLTLQDAAAVAAGYSWPVTGTVCDVGGGIGAQLSEILVRVPGARGVLYDSPRTLAHARTVLGHRGVLDRVRLEPGSFFEAVPGGADVYLLKNVLHDWDDEASLRILARVRDALGPDGRVVIAESLIERDSPDHPAVIADLQMMLVGDGGRERTEAELRDLLDRAGLRATRVVRTAMFVALVEAVRG